MLAVDKGLIDIVKYLLEVGANPNIPDGVITFGAVFISSLVTLVDVLSFTILWSSVYPMAG